MSSSSDTAGTQRVMDAYNQKGSQLTESETRAAIAGSHTSGGGSSSKPVTDMSQWYKDTQASQGYKPTEQQVSAAMGSYKSYLAGRGTTNPNDNRVWNTYGEVIGYNPSGGGYTDYSYQAANAIVNPNYAWTPDSRNDPNTQRFLTSTPLTGNYYDYNIGQLGKAPANLQTGFPGFINYAGLPAMADNWLANNPNSDWDNQGLIDLWKGQYLDLNEIPGYMNKYAHEFQGGKAPLNFSYNPNSLYGDAYTNPVGHIEMPQIGTVGKEPWELRLGEYRTNTRAGYDEIARAQQVYNQKMAEGDVAAAERAHIWANQIRDAMGISSQFDRATGAPMPVYENPFTPSGAEDNIFTQTQNWINLANQNKMDLYNTQNQYLQAYLDAQKEFANYPEYRPPERETFRFSHQPVSITSDGSDIHIPTLAAKQQWEAEQDAIQNRAYQQYATDYDRNKNIYTTTTEWLKLAMNEQQRQDDIARDAARYQAEIALANEKQSYDRALAMFNAGITTNEIYQTLGIPPGSKPFSQLMSEWQMDLAEKEYALSVTKASSAGSSGRSYGGSSGSSGDSSSPYYLDTQGERTNVMTGSLLELADNQYQLNLRSGGNASSHPLYYALDTLFNNPTWAKDVASTGADVKTVADYLITKYTGKSPQEYFATDNKVKGSRVEASYKSLLTQTQQEDWRYGGY